VKPVLEAAHNQAFFPADPQVTHPSGVCAMGIDWPARNPCSAPLVRTILRKSIYGELKLLPNSRNTPIQGPSKPFANKAILASRYGSYRLFSNTTLCPLLQRIP